MTDQAAQPEQAANPAAVAVHDGEGVVNLHNGQGRNDSIIIDTPPPAEAKQDTQSDGARQAQLLADRLGNELGQARKELKELRAQVEQSTFQVPQVPEPVSYDEDPQKFIQQSIDDALKAHLGPKLQMLESDLLQRKSVTFDERLSETYPDWKESVNSEDFANWVKQSQARIQMYQIADQNFDVDSAHELLKRFKQDQAEAASNKQGALNAAGVVENGGDSGGARVYAASEIRKLIETDPQEYQRWMAGEGMAAYRDGRVDPNR